MGKRCNPDEPHKLKYCEVCDGVIPKPALRSWSTYNKRKTCSTHCGNIRRSGGGKVGVSADALVDALSRW